jgi:phage terminase large subunit-like protein|nr:MAG TPA: Large Terminase [Caudoviricetes sp.]
MKEGKAYRYAQWCVEEDGGKVPQYVKKQAESWLHIADGDNPDAYVDEQEYEKICKLLKLMIHPDLRCSIYEGLEEYAWFMIVAGLCTFCRNTERKSRFYVTILLEIARKNFKTFNSAVIFILLMLTEPDFSRFFSVAPDLALSSELKNAIRKIIKVSPVLYNEDEPAFKLLRSQIKCLLNDNEYTPLAYSQDGMDGKLANAFLADEAGALDAYPVEAMRSSQITLLNKLGIIISTQYPNDNNVMLDEIDIAKKTLDGLLEDQRYFALLYEPDDELKHGDTWMTDDRVIYQSNPVAVTHPYIFEEIRKKRSLAILYENKRENYLCKHNDILYKGLGVEGYIDIQKVKMCSEDLPDDFWKEKQVWCGLDLSMTNDNTSFAMVTEQDGIIYAKVWGFAPSDRIDEKSMKEKVDYRALIRKGECFACGDEVIDYGFVERFIIGLPEKYGVEVMQVGYDRYNAISTVQKLEQNEIECVEIKQHSSVLHMPTKLLKELILKKKIRYATNRMLEINFQNARCTEDTNKNLYVNKKKSSGKVDMVVSLINAMYLLQQELLYGEDDFVVQT